MTASLMSDIDEARAGQLAREIGRAVVDARTRRGETNKAAAAELRVASQTLTAVERGERPTIALPTALKILNRYGYTLRVVHADAGDRANTSTLHRIRTAAAVITEAMQTL